MPEAAQPNRSLAVKRIPMKLWIAGGATCLVFLSAAWIVIQAALSSGTRHGNAPPLAPDPSIVASQNKAIEKQEQKTRRGYDPIVRIPLVSAQAAGRTISDDDYVLGVELNGEARAYPLSMLAKPARHVLNDTLGGQSIAVTWCGISLSPLVFSRAVAGRTLSFCSTGELYRDNLILRDVETSSRWPQLKGEALEGPLTGGKLAGIPVVWTRWKTWRIEHPQTTVLNLPLATDFSQHDPTELNSMNESDYFSDFQWGLASADKAISWPFRELTRQSVVNDSFLGLSLVIAFDASTSTVTAFERNLDGTALEFRQGADGLTDVSTGSLWDPLTGQAIRGKLVGRRLKAVQGSVSTMNAWRRFHPECETRTAVEPAIDLL